jgi:hypothetical protein
MVLEQHALQSFAFCFAWNHHVVPVVGVAKALGVFVTVLEVPSINQLMN